ncbi:MAG: hypothetical protein COB02_00865 [Candidatus Cloacimonadota bacterium]|nr:MAG: hypothetical protein COB02_00865 [Candidatus Cloacimonadota bacterium]
MKNSRSYRVQGMIALQIICMLFLFGCGDSGNRNGAIRGTVFSNRSGGALTKSPETGVTVVAQGDAPPIIRTSVTDASGQYVISGLPIGTYKMGFQKDGFVSINVKDGASNVQSALDKEKVELYVESGSTITSPDIVLTERPAEGDGTVIVTLIDGRSGEKVNGATVILGVASTTNGSNGQYVLTVAVKANPDGSSTPQPLSLSAAADGYSQAGANITALAGQTVATTLIMDPKTGFLQGQITFSKFAELYEFTAINLSIDGLQIGDGSASGSVHPDVGGFFSIEVPVRTDANNRSYNLRVSGNGFSDEVVNNILAPVAGSVRVEVPPLIPETVVLFGTVPNAYKAGGAVVNLVGVSAGINGPEPVCNLNGEQTQGNFSIADVPVNTKEQLTVTVKIYEFDDSCKIAISTLESNAFTATNNGSGTFTVSFAN